MNGEQLDLGVITQEAQKSGKMDFDKGCLQHTKIFFFLPK